MTLEIEGTDYARIERAIRFLDAHRATQPSLSDVAAHVGLSEAHFQKLFTRWAGISPKRFVQYRTAEVVKRIVEYRRRIVAESPS
ncbi:MAG: AraC family transcriptional regulator [Proteobacteria bacterium]|nr:AraC family transcriptional regulator [Pseudomonadota bacterium]